MDIWFISIHISTLMIVLLLVDILKKYKKNNVHLIFLLMILCLFVWSIGRILEKYFLIYTGRMIEGFSYIYFTSIIFLPVCVLFAGLIIEGKKISYKHMLLIVPQVVSMVFLLTNHFHRLFIVVNTEYNSTSIYGFYFYIHSLISYIYIILGIYFMVRFSIKNSSLFSIKTMIILIGMLPVLLVNIIGTLNIFDMHFNSTPVAFVILTTCFYIANVKFEFFNLVPLAMGNIVNEISDCFVVVDTENVIIDFNEPLKKVFGNVIDIKRNIIISDIKPKYKGFYTHIQMIAELIKRSHDEKKTFFVDKHIEVENVFNRYFSIEVTPVIKKETVKGTIVLFKDITELKNTQSQLVAKEKLASLGQLTGGIAHSLKTPIASIGDSVELLDRYINEYDESIDEAAVTNEDHHEIAKDMKGCVKEIQFIINYMSEIISTVKNYSTDAQIGGSDRFSIKELKDTLLVLLNHELKRHNCKLNISLNIEDRILINGDIRNMLQVINVLISNAIESYSNKANGVVEFMVNLDSQDNIIISVKDFGKGIPLDIQNKLFNKMCTTKGIKGTGIGLYISKNIIEGEFNGKLTFESEEGIGSTFYIIIPGKNIERI
ncbi:UNVERIFIED_CONTAM: phospho-acceptor domain-containing protein [Acetivibrio alkalicellulosi]